MEIAIVDYGVGNIQSLKFAIQRLGFEAVLTDDPERILNAKKVFFPGVGEAKNAMERLKIKRLDLVVKKLKAPTLGICLGMQLMCRKSEEGQTDGLGILDCTVKRFSRDNKIPQIGWNTLNNTKGALFSGIVKGHYMYSVHSYYVPIIEQTIARSYYGLDYSSAIQEDNFYGVQFHPEKSGKLGSKLLLNFLNL